ncbi:uridine kinase [Irregularibacter muris]|uniref:Uridine kinase n=1 Tax=Irregularibacter muris TaxID=1796619 RepID=A0AAE3HG34_9FIRM|nr:uridine kinase [Irregularibacter muris]MCR1899995.1 uridine kinase [Irregularibacter muris]
MKIIGIAGGTGSGKTTLAYQIFNMLPENSGTMIFLDNYYRDQSHIPFETREKANYDHPDAIESALLFEHLKALKNGQTIQEPVYDFKLHTRSQETIEVKPASIIIVEGIFTLYYKEILDILDLKLFVDTESDIRFSRRLMRDIEERGRSIDSVMDQYFSTVKPMHDSYVEPTKKVADIIIPEGGHNMKALEVLNSYITGIVEKDLHNELTKSKITI